MASTSENQLYDVSSKPDLFELEAQIGKGSFSIVYRAKNTETQEVIALKYFRQTIKIGKPFRLAAKEIALMRILEHPNIITLKVYEMTRVCVYIGMEYARLGSLNTFINLNQPPLAEGAIRSVMSQLVSALDYMHQMGLFHGDLKPENILCMDQIADNPTIKICDFGLAEIKLYGCDNLYFNAGSALYMAPEVHLKYPVDCTCDLWSVGVVMYKMMFGRNLFNLSDADREIHAAYLKRRMDLNFAGSDRYSKNCVSLAKNLLKYDKHARISGNALLDHPFIKIQRTPINLLKLREDAVTHISQAFSNANKRNFGDALVGATQSIIELKFYHNVIRDDWRQRMLRRKWEEYGEFTSNMINVLCYQPMIENPESCNDDDFRSYLASTPKLRDGFDIGCHAEMFLVDGQTHKALELFRQSLEVLIPLMESEPRSSRKDILGKRIKKWIEIAESLKMETEKITGISGNSPTAQRAKAN